MVPAPCPCSLLPSSSALGLAGLGTFKGREKKQLPPSFGFCGAASPQNLLAASRGSSAYF